MLIRSRRLAASFFPEAPVIGQFSMAVVQQRKRLTDQDEGLMRTGVAVLVGMEPKGGLFVAVLDLRANEAVSMLCTAWRLRAARCANRGITSDLVAVWDTPSAS